MKCWERTQLWILKLLYKTETYILGAFSFVLIVWTVQNVSQIHFGQQMMKHASLVYHEYFCKWQNQNTVILPNTGILMYEVSSLFGDIASILMQKYTNRFPSALCTVTQW